MGVTLFILLTSTSIQAASAQETDQGLSEKELKTLALKSGITRVYIQSFTGQRVQDVKQIFLDTITEEPEYTVVELLPDQLENLGVLRVKVLDYNFWEKEERIKDPQMTTPMKLSVDTTNDTLLRRNVLVTVELSFFDALTGTVLLQGLFAQPFQQIYITEEDKKNRPDEKLEMLRNTKLLLYKVLDQMAGVPASKKLYLENGSGFKWYDSLLLRDGNRRIKKGNRLAEAGRFDQAILMWNIVLYEKEEEEPLDVYISNRASVYYNLGLIYHQKKDWWTAASMFSNANRIKQQLKFAQAWGDEIYLWLENQKKTELREESPTIDQMDVDEKMMEKQQPLIKLLESNEDMLLKPRILWPFDQNLKAKVKGTNKNTSSSQMPFNQKLTDYSKIESNNKQNLQNSNDQDDVPVQEQPKLQPVELEPLN